MMAVRLVRHPMGSKHALKVVAGSTMGAGPTL